MYAARNAASSTPSSPVGSTVTITRMNPVSAMALPGYCPVSASLVYGNITAAAKPTITHGHMRRQKCAIAYQR